MTAIVVIAGLVIALWLEHRTALTLPKPTGTFAIGRNVAEWRDANRELLIWMWYPSQPGLQNNRFQIGSKLLE